MRRVPLLITSIFSAVVVSACISGSYDQSIARSLNAGPEDYLQKAVVGPQRDGTFVVATTQVIDPAGTSIAFPGRPTDLALSPDERRSPSNNRALDGNRQERGHRPD